jgi:uncharacterized membrane-anchored protein
VDRRTKNLTKRLNPGEIAVIDHEDIDKVAAEALVDCRPAAVLNAAASITGRYPNLGPEIIVGAGIPLVDGIGTDLMDTITEGMRLTVDDDGRIQCDGQIVATGQVQDKAAVSAAMEQARDGLNDELESFVVNTLDYLRVEKDLLIDGVGVPEVATDLDGRHVLIVVRGYHYKEDLLALRSYIREFRPVLIGVDGGADAVLEAGYTPDMAIGDMDSITDRALRCGAEIVVHAYRDGRAPGLDRVKALGLQAVVFPSAGTSEDAAMLLADDRGASLIVVVGTHSTVIEYLDKGRAGMSSTFLTRLRIGGKLVDAKGVSRLYRQRITNTQLTVLVLAGLLALGVALASTAAGQIVYSVLASRVDDILSWARSWFVDAKPEASGQYLRMMVQ